MPLTPVSAFLSWCPSLPLSRLVAVAAIPLAVQIANSYFKITFLMTVFPCFPYKLMQQMLVFVLMCVGVGVLLFFPDGFSMYFGLSLKSLELFLVFVGSKSGSAEVELHHKVEIFFNCLVHLWS